MACMFAGREVHVCFSIHVHVYTCPAVSKKRMVTSQFGYLELLLTRSNFAGPLDFEIARVDCISHSGNTVPKKLKYLTFLATLLFRLYSLL